MPKGHKGHILTERLVILVEPHMKRRIEEESANYDSRGTLIREALEAFFLRRDVSGTSASSDIQSQNAAEVPA